MLMNSLEEILPQEVCVLDTEEEYKPKAQKTKENRGPKPKRRKR
jgi:hypothetical protein